MAGHDAVVIGSGPNGLAAAIRLAEAGLSVLVLEARDTPGGGCRSAELTLPGFQHDVCSSVHPMAVASPFLRRIGVTEGVGFAHGAAEIAHVLEGEDAVLASRDLDDTAGRLGAAAGAYTRLLGPLVRNREALLAEILAPAHVPRHPLLLARFGLSALLPASTVSRRLHGERARALFAGCAAHAVLPLDAPISAAVALVMIATAHGDGWPVAVGGSQRITDFLVQRLQSLGGVVECGREVASAADLPPARVHLFDTDPAQVASICAARLPAGYRRTLRRFRRAPGIFKVDYALDGPVPWHDPATLQAPTVHAGGTFADVAATEAEVHAGRVPERPFVIFVQACVADPSRAPEGRHTGWAYCHVPNGCDADMTDRIERQIERFAPGFRDRVLARHVTTPADQERYDRNCAGGDISGGLQDWRQLFTRPAPRWSPYLTPDAGIAICSSSTPPGGGVHGMCGANAAEALLRHRPGMLR